MYGCFGGIMQVIWELVKAWDKLESSLKKLEARRDILKKRYDDLIKNIANIKAEEAILKKIPPSAWKGIGKEGLGEETGKKLRNTRKIKQREAAKLKGRIDDLGPEIRKLKKKIKDIRDEIKRIYKEIMDAVPM